jgi:putative DNA primase/helicase
MNDDEKRETVVALIAKGTRMAKGTAQPPQSGNGAAQPPAARLAIIDVTAGELSRQVAEAQEALITTNAGVYQRGGQLVRVATLGKDDAQHGVERKAGSTVILPVGRDWLLLALSRAADFRKYDRRAKALRRIDPPGAVAAAMIAAAGEWTVPSLAGIVTAPTLRNDATLLDRPGYDAASHLYAEFDPAAFPTIKRQPTRADATAALATLADVFSECVFVDGAGSPHASVAIAAVLTACVRHALSQAPAFGLSAHQQSSGKTTTAKVAAQVALGRDPPVVAPTDDENELKKALFAILLAGDTVVLIDNVAKPVDSAALCAALTSAIYSDRLLGASQTISVPTAVTWLLTGNNLVVVGDLTTRVLLCGLDPEVERPEERDFQRKNFTDYVLEHRGALVAAALTIPLAYAAAGAPAVNAPRSRFTDWDALVRNPLLWLGAADPLATQEELRDSDPVRAPLVALLTAWHGSFGEQPASVADAIEAATAPGQAAHPQLLDALQAIAGEQKGEINARRLGKYLPRYLRRIENGYRFERTGFDNHTRRPLYRVVNMMTRTSSVSSTPHARDGNAS